jgi:hypothetical protein
VPVKIERDFRKIPAAILEHLMARVRDRAISKAQLEEFSEWLLSGPTAPDVRESPKGWYKRFSSFTVCGEGAYCKTFLASHVTAAKGFDLGEWSVRKKDPQKEE